MEYTKQAFLVDLANLKTYERLKGDTLQSDASWKVWNECSKECELRILNGLYPQPRTKDRPATFDNAVSYVKGIDPEVELKEVYMGPLGTFVNTTCDNRFELWEDDRGVWDSWNN